MNTFELSAFRSMIPLVLNGDITGYQLNVRPHSEVGDAIVWFLDSLPVMSATIVSIQYDEADRELPWIMKFVGAQWIADTGLEELTK